jgi:peroxiredoxin
MLAPAPRRHPSRSAPASAIALCGALLALALPAFVHALEVGEAPPEIGLTTLDGKPVTLAALRGKVVLIDFWASWCAPCKEEMPFLEGLHKRLGKRGLVVVGVSVDSELANAKRFIEGVKVSFPIVHDAKHSVADRYRPARMPTSLIVDRAGKIRFVHGGFRKDDAKTIEQEISKLLE